MGDWKIVVPEATTNLLKDPSFEKADPDTEWTIAGDGGSPDFTRSTTQSYHGNSSAVGDIDGGTVLEIYQSVTVTATSYTLSVKARTSAGGLIATAIFAPYWNSAPAAWDSVTALRDGWYLCVKTGTPTAGARNFGIRWTATDGGFIDGIQLENLGYRTTYCDGDQPGCSWLGEQYSSASERSAQSRDGGRIYDFEDDIGVYAESFTGTGMMPVKNIKLDYAAIPGSEHVRTKLQDRVIILTLWTEGSSTSTLHDLRQDLIEKMGPDIVNDQQSFWLRYHGASVPKQIKVRYEAGLESGRWKAYEEDIALRLWAEDPLWYTTGELSVVLDPQDGLDHLGIAGRVDGVWTDVGTPSAGGTVYTIVRGTDGCIYIGGDFTNWDGIANADYIVKWDPVAESYSALGTGMAGGAVYALVFMPNGDLIAGGAFTGAGGVSNTDEVARWDGSAWNSMGGAATNATVYALAVDNDGYLYAGGNFTSIGGYSIDRIARWDGLYWADVGGADDEVYALAVDNNGDLIAGGDFLEIGNRTVSRLASYDGANWTAMGTTVSNSVKSIAVGPDGTIYIAGAFTEPYSYVCGWNGTTFFSLGTGYASSSVNALAVGPDGRVYAGGVLVEEPVAPPTPPESGGWWDPNDDALPIWGAWKAKGADSYTASKQDVSGMGHHLSELGGTMKWSTTNGWELTYSSGKALDTGFLPDSDQLNQTIIVQFSNASATYPLYLVGCKNSSGARFTIRLDGSRPGYWAANGDDYTYESGTLPTNIAIAGNDHYGDGVDEGDVSDWTTNATLTVTIGAHNTPYGLTTKGTCYIEGVAIYTGDLTAGQIAAIENEMQAW